MRVTLEPQFLTQARVRIPSSKSVGHRLLIASALAKGTSALKGIGRSADIEATMNALRAFGAGFEEKGDTILVHGIAAFEDQARVIDCGESGSTLRFLIPLAALSEAETLFTGRGRLMARPQGVYEKIFAEQNLLFCHTAEGIRIKGPLKAGKYTVEGNISSQFISGLLFALPLLEADSEITVREPFESSAYVTLTQNALKAAGIRIEQNGLTFRIKGKQTYQAVNAAVDGDDSQAAFFAALALTHQMPVAVEGIAHDSAQPDHVIFSLVSKAGADVRETEEGYLIEPGRIQPLQADLSQCPDLGPVLFALAAAAEGTSVFTGTMRLRIKESDRVAAMQEELTKLGCRMDIDGDTVYVHGMPEIEGGVELDSHNDHRIVMALAILSARALNPVKIEGAEAINKSYPDFFRDLEKAGMKVSYD